MNRVLEEIELLVEKNFYEVVFTGIHLGGWGEDLHGAPHPTITELINEIERRRFRARFRLSSIDPDEITDPLIEALATAESFCNHVHMPLQSGDDSILRRMKRPYSVAFFAERVARLMHTVKEISIGTDIITGFPGESEVEFENTFSFLSELPISYMHIFPYSGRKGTAAAGMEGQVDPRAIKERAVRLKELEGAKREAFYSGLLGKTALVLAEGKEGAGGAKKGLLKGRSRNYVPVEFECPADGAQGEHRLLLTGLTGKGMFGEIENASQPASL